MQTSLKPTSLEFWWITHQSKLKPNSNKQIHFSKRFHNKTKVWTWFKACSHKARFLSSTSQNKTRRDFSNLKLLKWLKGQRNIIKRVKECLSSLLEQNCRKTSLLSSNSSSRLPQSGCSLTTPTCCTQSRPKAWVSQNKCKLKIRLSNPKCSTSLIIAAVTRSLLARTSPVMWASVPCSTLPFRAKTVLQTTPCGATARCE
jgi:hypothetical protein